MVQSEEQLPSEAYRKVRYEVNCVSEAMTVLSGVSYDGDGDTIETSHQRGLTEPVIPGSVGSYIFTAVCTEQWQDEPPGISFELFLQVAQKVLADNAS